MSGPQLPISNALDVDQLLSLYDGILTQADEALREAQISATQERPSVIEGLDGHVKFGPHGDPMPPEDMTALDDLTLGKLSSCLLAWTNYVSAETTRGKCLMDVVSKQNKVVVAALRRHYREVEGVSAALLDDYVLTDARHAKIDTEITRLKVFVSTAEARYDQLRRSLNNLSREQTRRQNENEGEMNEERGRRASRYQTDEHGDRIRPKFKR